MPTALRDDYRSHLVLLFKRLLFVLGLYTLLRAMFLALNWVKFQDASFSEILSPFWLGIKFDLSAIFSINAIFVLFSLLPHPWLGSRAYQAFLKALFFVFNWPFLVMALVDIKFYLFTDRRSTVELVHLAKEIQEQALQLTLHYWPAALTVLLSGVLLLKLYPKAPPREIKTRLSWLAVPAIPLVAVLAVLGIRGSVGVRPLASGHAFIYRLPALGNLALNTPFVFIKSIQGSHDGETTRKLEYLSAEKVASILKATHGNPQERPLERDNVFIIIVESLSSDQVGFENGFQGGHTPFLDSLAKKGVAFTHHFANSKRSITALPAILAGIPDWFGGAFSTSIYQSNTVLALGHALRKHGYQTTFFHGTRDGTMTFDYMSRIAGFENYYALSAYGAYAPEDHDGAWGIYDEPMLQRVAQKFGEMKEPFAGAVFTLSTHQPFSVPKKYQGRFKAENSFASSIAYTDYAIQRFFEVASTQPWFSRTLFVITGDHTGSVIRPSHDTPLGIQDVPLLFYHPGKKLVAPDPQRIAHQADIGPSILDLLGMKNEKTLPFGRSLFSPGPGLALLRFSEAPVLLKDGHAVVLSGSGESNLYEIDFDHQKLLPSRLVGEQRVEKENTLKAYLQYFHNGLVENSWF